MGARPLRIACFLLWFAGFGAGVGLSAQAREEETRPITTAFAAHEITLEEAARELPVRLRAVVTYYDPYIDPRRPAFFVSDATGSIFVALAVTPPVPLKPGDLVEVTGTTGAGDFAPIVDHAQARVVGHAPLPAFARRVGINDLLIGNTDGQWVEVEGVVHAVRQVDHNVFLDLALTDGQLTVFTVRDPEADFARLVDSKVLVRGNAAPLFNHQGQMTGTHMLFPGMVSLVVEEGALADPFHLPLEALGNLLRYQPKSGLRHRVHVRGVVTLLWPGQMICVQSGAAGMCAQTNQKDSVRVGETADVVGFPMMGRFTPTMVASTYRRSIGGGTTPAVAIDAKQAISAVHDAQLVTIDGQLIGEGRDGEDPALILSAQGLVFSASLPADVALAPGNAPEPGTWLRVTGICSVQADTSGAINGSGYSLGKSFRILQRSQADVVVLRRPSWWNAQHSLTVLAVATLIAAGALAGLIMLRKKVKEQTAVIRDQLAETIALKDAAEYQATHDGLTGLRNRKAIFALLSKEFDPAAQSGPSIGIIMLDLDHFKSVNDTHGHAVGDLVLQETARRLVRAVRDSDFVGRYGGEEFLIVMPNCDTLQCLICAERIRASIAVQPIDGGEGVTLRMTASLGTAVAISHLHTEQQALTAADAALYQAKRNGRNQVASLDPKAMPHQAEEPKAMEMVARI